MYVEARSFLSIEKGEARAKRIEMSKVAVPSHLGEVEGYTTIDLDRPCACWECKQEHRGEALRQHRGGCVPQVTKLAWSVMTDSPPLDKDTAGGSHRAEHV